MKKILVSCLVLVLCGVQAMAQQISSDMRMLLSSEGKVLYGEEPNSIMVMDYPENVKRIAEYLDVVDVAPAQVLIEARVVEVRLTDQQSLGVNWQLFGAQNLDLSRARIGSAQPESIGEYDYTETAPIGGASRTITQPESSRNVLKGALEQVIPWKATTEPGGTDAENPFTFSIFEENINVVVSALANSYNTEILSAPRVATVNNRAAEIRIVQTVPWGQPSVTISDTGYATVTWTVNFENVGITLQVTPTINENGGIIMTLNPEISEKVDDYELSVSTGTGDAIPYTVPVIDRRMASTKVLMKNGQTLILGGLIRSKNTKKETKVPFLGDIPFMGNLFKSTYDSKEKTELLIFVSPTIITDKELARMDKQYRYGVGKTFAQDRERQEKMMLVMETNEVDKNSKLMSDWELLLKKQEALAQQTKQLEQTLRSEESSIKDLEAEKEAVIRKRKSLTGR